MTLAEARAKAAELRKAVKVEKRDVLTERKDEEAAKVTSAKPHPISSENEAGWKSDVYGRQWLASWRTTRSEARRHDDGGITRDIIVLTPIGRKFPKQPPSRNRICAC